MRYIVRRPAEPTDPRGLEIKHLDELDRIFPRVGDYDLEERAVTDVRTAFPNGVVMPVPVPLRIGSGDLVLLGVIPDIHAPRDPGGMIQFVMFVQAMSENDVDRQTIKKHQQFHRDLWNVKVMIEIDHVLTAKAELRATDLEIPAKVDVHVGRRNGRLIVRTELNGVALSLLFDDPDLQFTGPVVPAGTPMAPPIEEIESPPANVPSDG